MVNEIELTESVFRPNLALKCDRDYLIGNVPVPCYMIENRWVSHRPFTKKKIVFNLSTVLRILNPEILDEEINNYRRDLSPINCITPDNEKIEGIDETDLLKVILSFNNEISKVFKYNLVRDLEMYTSIGTGAYWDMAEMIKILGDDKRDYMSHGRNIEDSFNRFSKRVGPLLEKDITYKNIHGQDVKLYPYPVSMSRLIRTSKNTGKIKIIYSFENTIRYDDDKRFISYSEDPLKFYEEFEEVGVTTPFVFYDSLLEYCKREALIKDESELYAILALVQNQEYDSKFIDIKRLTLTVVPESGLVKYHVLPLATIIRVLSYTRPMLEVMSDLEDKADIVEPINKKLDNLEELLKPWGLTKYIKDPTIQEDLSHGIHNTNLFDLIGGLHLMKMLDIEEKRYVEKYKKSINIEILTSILRGPQLGYGSYCDDRFFAELSENLWYSNYNSKDELIEDQKREIIKEFVERNMPDLLNRPKPKLKNTVVEEE